MVNNVPLGFTFPFFGNNYTTVNISVNGYLTFSPITGSTYTRPSGTPNSAIPNNYIAGAWFDGGGSTALPTNAAIYTQQIGTSPNAELRVQFVNWPYYDNTGSDNFIYRLLENGAVEVHYGVCDAFAYAGASTGIEDSTGSTGFASAGGFERFTTPTQADRFELPGPTAPVLATPLAPSPPGAVLITEVACDPGTSGDEYCEIQNVSPNAVTLTNWTITAWDGSTTPLFTDTVNTVTLQPGDRYVFCDYSGASVPAFDQAFSANLLWDGSDCGAMLRDDTGAVVDCVFWGNMSVASITSPVVVGANWTGAALGTQSLGSSFERGGATDNDDASDWSSQTSPTIGTTNAGLTLPLNTVNIYVTVGGTSPNFTGLCYVGDNLDITFPATDVNITDTLTTTVTVSGGTLTAAQAGFNQTFTGGVYSDPAPGNSPHNLTLDGTAATVGTITLTVQVSDGSLTDTYTFDLTIDPPPPAEINLKNGSANDVLTGTTDTITAAIPVGYPQTYNYTIENLDVGTLHLNGSPIVANTAASNCTFTVNQPAINYVGGNNSIGFSVDVTASSAAAWSVSFSIDNDDSNENPYTFTIAGMAYDPTPEIDVQRPASNSIAVGGTDTVTGTADTVPTTLTYTIENQDLGDLVLSGSPLVDVTPISNCNASLQSGPSTPITYNNTTTFVVSLTPTAAATWSFTISIANNDANEDPYTFTVTGVAAAAPAPEIDLQRPASTSIAVGATDNVTGTLATAPTALTYTIANTGNLALSVSSPNITTTNGCSATISTSPPPSIAASSTGTFTLTVTPSAQGNWSFGVSMANGDSNENPYTWTVSGNAGPAPAPEIDLQRPAGTSIPVNATDSVTGTVAGTLTTLTYTIANTGNAALTCSTPNITSMNNCTALLSSPPPANIAASSTGTMNISVTPSAQGAWSFSASMVNGDANENPYTWTVSGNAQATPAPEIDVQQPAGSSIPSGGNDVHLNFTGTQTVTYTIENQGALVLNVTGVTISNQAACTATVTMQPATTVAVGSTTTFDVQVVAPSSGAYTFTISIANNDANENPYVINFSGNTGSGVSTGGGGGGGGGGCTSGPGTGYAWLLLALLAVPVVIYRRRRA
ncbi:MAG: choice-of-anchor D domain-containing protein [Planctomycetes bacterium]|nr:choice-of-anchor D domain-containing protein [Planctomycetota bacterium]